jgi:hypothetical protein
MASVIGRSINTEQFVEQEFSDETEIPEKMVPRHIVQSKYHATSNFIETKPPGLESSD